MSWEEEMLRTARQTNRWLRILALPALREALSTELSKPEFKRLYEASDGRSIREVAASAKVGVGTVHRYWQTWAAQGLLEPTESPGRFRRVVSLAEIGLEE
jgi:hypothetical protein